MVQTRKGVELLPWDSMFMLRDAVAWASVALAHSISWIKTTLTTFGKTGVFIS